jgi:putative polyhydroxyalkanoate system protein
MLVDGSRNSRQKPLTEQHPRPYYPSMPKPITINLPHKLTQAEARNRIESALAEARRHYPAYAGTLRETWTGNRMEFTLSAMGQTVTGRIDLLPDSVQVQIDLPVFLAMVADALRSRIEREGKKLLAAPK